MNGVAHKPKSSELADASPLSSSTLRGAGKYSPTTPRSAPPRSILLVLLSAQLVLLAIARLGPGAGSLLRLNSSDELLSPASPSLRGPLSFVPQTGEEPSVLQTAEESPVLSHSSASSLSKSAQIDDDGKVGKPKVKSTERIASHIEPTSASSLKEEFTSKDVGTSGPSMEIIENTDKGTDMDGSALNAAAVDTATDGTEREQFLIAEQSSGTRDIGLAEAFLEAQRDTSQDLELPEERRTTVSELNQLNNLRGKGKQVSPVMEERGEFTSTALDGDGFNVENAYTKIVNEESVSPSECAYGYVYVYDLPPMFNADIVANCKALNVFRNVCDTVSNSGLGASLGNSSPLGQEGSWFKSDQFTAEVVFHKRILQYPCLTDNVEQASSFYVPYYAGLDVGRYLWREFSAERRDRVGNKLLEWLVEQPAWRKNGGWGHFLMVGRITWDFRRSKDEDWGSGFFYHPLMQNMTRLLIEKNPWDYMEMAVPYLTSFHPKSDAHLVAWQHHIRASKRSKLFSFAGAPRRTFPNDFRGILLDQCQKAQSCQSLDCSKRRCQHNQRTLELFMDSTFCLQPRGDSFTRRSTFDCLLAGSIPVFFWHRTAYMQYKWHLPEDGGSYSVFISKDAMRNGTWIEDVLGAFSQEQVQRMREAVIEMVPRLVYAASGLALRGHKDAFDVAMEGVMKRFKELNLSPQK